MWLQILIAVLISPLLYYYFVVRKPRLRHIPGPRGWPIVGNLLQFDALFPHTTSLDWCKKFGAVYYVRLVNDNWLFVNSYEAFNELLLKKGDDFAGRPINYRYSLYSRNYSGIIFSYPSPEIWKPLRKEAHKGIKQYSSGMQRIEDITCEVVDNVLDSFEKMKGAPFDPREKLYAMTISTLLALVTGERIEEGSPYFKMVQTFDQLYTKSTSFSGTGAELDIFPWLRHFKNSTFANFVKAEKNADSFWAYLHPLLEDKYTKTDFSCVVHNMMQALRHLKGDNKTTGGINNDDAYGNNIRQATIDLILAGTLTTTTSVYCLFNILLHYPEVKRKLQAEIDHIIGPSRRVAFADRDNMPYMRATILELLRYTTVVVFSVPHTALVNTSIMGYEVPAGTNLVPNIWALHHEEEFWKDPWVFRPERFLDKDGQVLLADHETRKHLMAFGAGPRVCVGEMLGVTRIFLIAASVLQRFQLEAEDETHLIPCDPRTYELGMVLYPKSYKIRMLHRFN